MLKLEPFQLSVKNEISNKWVQEFIYRKGWEDSAINICQKEAMRYVYWAEKTLPLLTKLKRFPLQYECTEKITNWIIQPLQYKLE